MNKIQWWVLAGGSYVLTFLFMFMAGQAMALCNSSVTTSLACTRWQAFAPYPYIFGALGFIFLILASLEDD